MINLSLLKQQLDEEKKRPYINTESSVECSAFTHNECEVILQFWGWAIHLYPDGTYYHEKDSSGG